MYPAVVLIFAWPIIAFLASSGAPASARCVEKKWRALRMVTEGSPASSRERFQRRRSTVLVSGCHSRVNMSWPGWHCLRPTSAQSPSHVWLLTGTNRLPCLLFGSTSQKHPS